MTESEAPAADALVVEEQVSFTLASLCRASEAELDQVQALVVEGLLQPLGRTPEEWRFAGAALPLTRRALRLARELEIELAAVGVVMDLLDELERLRSRQRQP